MTAASARDCAHSSFENRRSHPDWHNGPVRTWYPARRARHGQAADCRFSPRACRGANRTGRPFTGDYSGDLLYATLGKFRACRPVTSKHGWMKACACRRPRSPRGALRAPENKPLGAEISTCRNYLAATIRQLDRLVAIVTLGKIAHDSTVRALGGRLAEHPFGHASETDLEGKRIISSYHCSRYNTNTGRLTPAMFEAVFKRVSQHLAAAGSECGMRRKPRKSPCRP